METDYIMETNFIIVTERLYLVRPSQEYLTDLHSLHSDREQTFIIQRDLIKV